MTRHNVAFVAQQPALREYKAHTVLPLQKKCTPQDIFSLKISQCSFTALLWTPADGRAMKITVANTIHRLSHYTPNKCKKLSVYFRPKMVTTSHSKKENYLGHSKRWQVYSALDSNVERHLLLIQSSQMY
jgi:hypothetical protein